MNTLGPHHLTWHRGFTVDGEEMGPLIFPAYVSETKKKEHPEWDVRTIETLGMTPNRVLQYYYYID